MVTRVPASQKMVLQWFYMVLRRLSSTAVRTTQQMELQLDAMSW